MLRPFVIPPSRICFNTAKPTLEVAKATQDCAVVPIVAMAIVATNMVFLLMIFDLGIYLSQIVRHKIKGPDDLFH